MSPGDPAPEWLGLATDLYELTMVDAYLAEGMLDTAVFSLFVRRLPARRNFLLAAGLADTLDCIERFRFSQAALDSLASLGLFSEQLLAYLEQFRFSGEVRAAPEGTPVFASEPLVEVTAPLPEGQLLESLVMNQVQLQTVAASKAARIVAAARGRRVVDFGMRRAHGLEAAVKVARAASLAGFAGTSNVMAGRRYGVPVVGTMAHSYVQAHDTEEAAFEAFLRRFPQTTLLVDTYDTLEGVRKVIRLALKVGPGSRPRAIRLDSGDLATLAAESRRLLDEAGLPGVEIFASGGLDEGEIARLVEQGAPIEAFGVGSALAVAEGAAHLDIAYKLVSYAGAPRMKLSAGKVTWPHAKQVFRVEVDGVATHDVLACLGEELEGRPLLDTVMRGGARVGPEVSLAEARARAHDELGRLPGRLRELSPPAEAFPVEISPRLSAQTNRLITSLSEQPHRGVR